MRLIDADKLEIDWLNYTGNVGVDFKLYLENVPTIEATPIIHAKWIRDKLKDYCSNCGADYGNCYDLVGVKYCYRCGAKMDLKDD